ncbi:MAG: hypothetical protein ABS911_12525 [Carnobacterium sp.]|uniref:hypothetical protein n=1 Tax=Carnobacterium sp. TaxID=48221 RepID=UPI0033148A44
MVFVKNSIGYKWPILLFEAMFLIGGIFLITAGIKIRKQTPILALIIIVIGSILILVSLFILLYTFVFGYNS